MKLKSKKTILTEKIELVTSWIVQLNKEFKNGERDANDYLHEMDKKQWALRDAVKELEYHLEWLDSIK